MNIIYEKRPNLRPPVLRQAVPLYPNYVYNSSQVNRAYSDLMALGYFKSAKIAFEEQPRSADVTDIVSFIGASADSTQTLYTREGYLTCNISLHADAQAERQGRSRRQHHVEFLRPEGHRRLSEPQYFPRRRVVRPLLHGGLRIYEGSDARRKRATEFGVTTGLTFPRFLAALAYGPLSRTVNQPKTKVELSINFQDRPYYARTLSSAGITYMWTNERSSFLSLRPIDINVVDMTGPVDPEFLGNTSNKYLINSYKTQFIGGLSFGYGYNNQRKNLGGNATNMRFNAGDRRQPDRRRRARLLLSPDKGKEQYTIFGIEYSQYFRVDLSASRKIMLGENTAHRRAALRRCADWPTATQPPIPFDRLFYCGGSNGMRGWIAPYARPRIGAGRSPTR